MAAALRAAAVESHRCRRRFLLGVGDGQLVAAALVVVALFGCLAEAPPSATDPQSFDAIDPVPLSSTVPNGNSGNARPRRPSTNRRGRRGRTPRTSPTSSTPRGSSGGALGDKRHYVGMTMVHPSNEQQVAVLSPEEPAPDGSKKYQYQQLERRGNAFYYTNCHKSPNEKGRPVGRQCYDALKKLPKPPNGEERFLIYQLPSSKVEELKKELENDLAAPFPDVAFSSCMPRRDLEREGGFKSKCGGGVTAMVNPWYRWYDLEKYRMLRVVEGQQLKIRSFAPFNEQVVKLPSGTIIHDHNNKIVTPSWKGDSAVLITPDELVVVPHDFQADSARSRSFTDGVTGETLAFGPRQPLTLSGVPEKTITLFYKGQSRVLSMKEGITISLDDLSLWLPLRRGDYELPNIGVMVAFTDEKEFRSWTELVATGDGKYNIVYAAEVPKTFDPSRYLVGPTLPSDVQFSSLHELVKSLVSRATVLATQSVGGQLGSALAERLKDLEAAFAKSAHDEHLFLKTMKAQLRLFLSSSSVEALQKSTAFVMKAIPEHVGGVQFNRTLFFKNLFQYHHFLEKPDKTSTDYIDARNKPQNRSRSLAYRGSWTKLPVAFGRMVGDPICFGPFALEFDLRDYVIENPKGSVTSTLKLPSKEPGPVRLVWNFNRLHVLEETASYKEVTIPIPDEGIYVIKRRPSRGRAGGRQSPMTSQEGGDGQRPNMPVVTCKCEGIVKKKTRPIVKFEIIRVAGFVNHRELLPADLSYPPRQS